MIYNVLSISAVHRSNPVMHICTFFGICLLRHTEMRWGWMLGPEKRKPKVGGGTDGGQGGRGSGYLCPRICRAGSEGEKELLLGGSKG